jgi:uncharacterized membrane protein YhaH (DUF805 family)
MATIYLILAIEFMYFKHKRAHWNEWAQWQVSKLVVVIYSLAILVVVGLSIALLAAGLASQIWTIFDGLGHILTTVCAGLLLAVVLCVHLIVYISMKPKQEDNKKRIEFVNRFELPSWSAYIVYAFAFIYMLATVAVTIALGYARFTAESISNAWLLSNLIGMGFDIIVIRTVGVFALGYFAPKISSLIKALLFTAPMAGEKKEKTATGATATDAPQPVAATTETLTITDVTA